MTDDEPYATSDNSESPDVTRMAAERVADDLETADAEDVEEAFRTDGPGDEYEVIGRILDDAKETVTQDRSDTHGHVRDNLENTARFWNAYITARTGFDPELDGTDAALMMDLGKTSRAATGSRDPDHFEDKNGYSAIAGALEIVPSPDPDDD